MNRKAEEDRHLANEKPGQPKEDVVSYAACYHTKEAMQALLRSFLISKGEKPMKKASLAGLREQCAAIDPKFSRIDLSAVNCQYDNKVPANEDCLEKGKIKECLNVVQSLCKMVS